MTTQDQKRQPVSVLWRPDAPENTLAGMLHAKRKELVEAELSALSQMNIHATAVFTDRHSVQRREDDRQALKRHILKLAATDVAYVKPDTEKVRSNEMKLRPDSTEEYREREMQERAANWLRGSFRDYRIFTIIEQLQPKLGDIAATEAAIRDFLEDQTFDANPCLTSGTPPTICRSELNRAILAKMLEGDGERTDIREAVRHLWGETTDEGCSLEALRPLWEKASANYDSWNPELIKPAYKPFLRDANECIQFIELFQLSPKKAALLMKSYLNYSSRVDQYDKLTLAAFAYQYGENPLYANLWGEMTDPSGPLRTRFHNLAGFYHFDKFFNFTGEAQELDQPLLDKNGSKPSLVKNTKDFVNDARQRDKGRAIRRYTGVIFDALLLATMTEMMLNSPHLWRHAVGKGSPMDITKYLTFVAVMFLLFSFIYTATLRESNRVKMRGIKGAPTSSTDWVRAGFFGGSIIAGAGMMAMASTSAHRLSSSSNLIIIAALILAGTLIQKLSLYKNTTSPLYPMREADKKTAKWGSLLTCLGVTGSISSVAALYFIPTLTPKALPIALFGVSALCVILGALLHKKMDLGSSVAQNSRAKYGCFELGFRPTNGLLS